MPPRAIAGPALLCSVDIIAKNDDNGHMQTYPGGKGGGGVYQKIINLIPPHQTYIETHLGGGAIMRYKKPAIKNIGIDIDSIVIQDWRKRNLSTKLIQSDAVEYLKKYKFKDDEFVYSDPPYLLESRRSRRIYRHEYTKKQHFELLKCLKSLPCKVMISGYWSKLYSDTLANWSSFSFQAQTQNGTAVEWVWFNYPQPTKLHDYRFLGDTFRERERIKRKKMRWVKKLESMPRLEHQALLDAMDTAFVHNRQL